MCIEQVHERIFMNSLSEDLQSSKKNLDEFALLTTRIIQYLPNVITSKIDVKGYIVYMSEVAGTKKYVRPINKCLFIFNNDEFIAAFTRFKSILNKLKKVQTDFNEESCDIIDKVIYTIQQSVGIGLDLLVNPNSARKHVGNRFEELIRFVISALGISNKKIILKIPYTTDDGKKMYSCETDLVCSPYKKVKSSSKNIDPREVVISLKTTSKDRMGKIFIDKLLMQQFAKQKIKLVGIFLNDVQRKESNNISYTFVSGLFMVYTEFLTILDGVYFVDPPPKINESPFNKYIYKFSKLITHDIWRLLG